ncbi:3\'-5\' exonuclease family protein [Ectocarpus siliculosus]|uniref:3\'-5\' exonuclease family protein n=1 Tax=Ectocarpus siliculosus TaxID=2880 RepID=D8LQB4_ECTSI|nr:3\'-5\' exonuclease family protein [Ectocarpus siliculosus]|eukprot:CBN77494.1 3\'-5\' exonuclease family protein [Ectocarpus siliculosus]
MSIDTETQPSFAVGEWHPTSLLQVATRDADGEEDVLVIDLLSLKDGLLLPESLSEALSGPFGSPNVVKLGVGLANDLDEMSFAFEETPFLEQVPGVLNLNALNTKLTGGACNDQGIPRDLGLRKLASMYLGRSLSKRQQMSRWARRPLQSAQVNYAACDALVALRVFDALLLALGSLDVGELCTTWTPRRYS